MKVIQSSMTSKGQPRMMYDKEVGIT